MTLSLSLHMVVDNDACRASFDGSCDNHLGNNWSGAQAEYIRFHFLPTGPLSKFLDNLQIIVKVMLKSLLTLADSHADGLPCGACG